MSSWGFASSLICSMGADPGGRRNSMAFRMQNSPKIRPKTARSAPTCRNLAKSGDSVKGFKELKGFLADTE